MFCFLIFSFSQEYKMTSLRLQRRKRDKAVLQMAGASKDGERRRNDLCLPFVSL